MSLKGRVARLILAIVGAMAIVWACVVFPVFRSEEVVTDVARAIVAGEAFKPEVLSAVDARAAEDSVMRRSSLLDSAAMIRLRRAEDAVRSGHADIADERRDSLAQLVDKTLENAPNDSFMWFVRFRLESARDGIRADNLRFLRMSYDIGPYEAWIALKRDRIAMAAFAALPDDLRERAISEFVGLVRWGLVADAADIAAGLGRPLRTALFLRLNDLDYKQRRAFADAFYPRELDDVPVPGIAPPTPQIPMPVLPPDL